MSACIVAARRDNEDAPVAPDTLLLHAGLLDPHEQKTLRAHDAAHLLCAGRAVRLPLLIGLRG